MAIFKKGTPGAQAATAPQHTVLLVDAIVKAPQALDQLRWL